MALGTLMLGAVVSLGSGRSEAGVQCHQTAGGRRICVNAPSGGGCGARGCYYLPTVSNGRANGLRKVCR